MDTPTTDELKHAAVIEGRDPLTRRLLLLLAIVFLASSVVAGISAVRWVEGQNRQDAANELTISTLITTANDNKDAAKALEAQIEKLGKTPVVNTESLPTVPQSIARGETGARGPAGPAPSTSLLKLLVQQALVISCPPDGNCKGQAGSKGDKGDSVKGDTGASGTNGTNGTDGKNGLDAPKITNITCDATTGVFTFNDDSTIRVDNMCAAPLIPAG